MIFEAAPILREFLGYTIQELMEERPYWEFKVVTTHVSS